ncbi:MAG: 30S ribosomal protein S6 [Candidatus Levyibacteriota bacterium]
MRTYELVVVVRPTLTEPQRKKLLETVKGWLKDVKVVKENDWGSKALEYKIKRELTGFYYDFMLETQESVPTDFEKRLINDENVLRHLLVRTK